MKFPRRRFLHLAGWGVVLPMLTRIAGTETFPMRIGDLVVYRDKGRIAVNDGSQHLTSTEFELLKLLWLHKGQAVSRNVMLNHLYAGSDEPEPRIVDVFIATLRFKIFKATGGTGSIRLDAVAARGYRLRAA